MLYWKKYFVESLGEVDNKITNIRLWGRDVGMGRKVGDKEDIRSRLENFRLYGERIGLKG